MERPWVQSPAARAHTHTDQVPDAGPTPRFVTRSRDAELPFRPLAGLAWAQPDHSPSGPQRWASSAHCSHSFPRWLTAAACSRQFGDCRFSQTAKLELRAGLQGRGPIGSPARHASLASAPPPLLSTIRGKAGSLRYPLSLRPFLLGLKPV